MNQEKIGKFIASERKKKKLTQIELAEKIGVSNSAVSKWETGNGMPDYSVFSNLCKTLDITVNELLAGERNTKDDKVISEYMKIRDKKNKTKIVGVLIVSVLILLCFIFGTFFFNSYKTIKMYELTAINDNFSYTYGTYLESKITTVFTEGQFKIVNLAISEEDIIDKKFAIKDDGKYYWFGNVDSGTLAYENYLYGDKFSIADLQHLPYDLYIIVWYYFDGEILYDEIKVEAKEILSNDKLVDLKTENIAANPDTKLDGLIDVNKYSKSNEYMNYLLDKGFVEANTCANKDAICPILKKEIGKETITINYLEKSFAYERKDDVKIYTLTHCYDNREDGMKCSIGGNKEIEIRIWEPNGIGDYFYLSHTYDLKDKTIDFQKINKDNEKYMVYFNRFKELYDKYRPQEG